jgi:CBS domain-containing protein
MTNRSLAYIIKDQKPLVLGVLDTAQEACRRMCERRAGSVLVVDEARRLRGIFTGRDAVRLLSKGMDPGKATLGEAMTSDPVTITSASRAIDALRTMSEHGFRHLPVVDDGRIWGVVSRGDFKGSEIDRLDEEEHLWECIR